MSDILTVKDFTILSALPNHEQGEVAFCEDTKDYYVYNNGWQKMNMKMNSDGVQMSLYDFNRQIVEQLPAFGDTQWIGAESIFSDWDAKDKHEYYMLYGKEVSYFTIFKKKHTNGEFNSLFEAVKECLINIGDVHSFDIVDDGTAIEIWVKTEEVMTCFYLFNYDEGIVTFNG